jgi:hypothetical protein
MVLHCGRRPFRLRRPDIRGHMHGLHLAELANPLRFAPAQNSAGSSRISRPRVSVPSFDGEELDEAQQRWLPYPFDQRRQRHFGGRNGPWGAHVLPHQRDALGPRRLEQLAVQRGEG